MSEQVIDLGDGMKAVYLHTEAVDGEQVMRFKILVKDDLGNERMCIYEKNKRLAERFPIEANYIGIELKYYADRFREELHRLKTGRQHD